MVDKKEYVNLDEKIKSIVKEIMGIDMTKLDKNKKINTISEWDSFNNLMLISKFQDDLGVEFTASEIEATLTIGDLYSLIHSKVKN